MNATVKIERPDGKIETVESKLSYITDAIFSEMKKVAAKNNRGTLLSYDNHGNKSPEQQMREVKTSRQQFAAMHAAANKERGLCPHCGTYCDGDCR